ncbi:MAG: YebC/PmpR family DNA-binding transcriptional regulator [Candidatus Bipolaricaulia bacterium]
MAGHSKWDNIKHQKARQDAARGKLFSKLTKEITMAARDEPDPGKNPKLAQAMERAKQANMPKENIERAIKRATGELPGVTYEEYIYDGFGPYGVAVMVRVVTDNRNRAVASIRNVFDDYGGDMDGSVDWIFERRGRVTAKLASEQDPDEVLMTAIDLGTEDMDEFDEEVQIACPPEHVSDVKTGLEDQGVEITDAKVAMVPKTTVPLEGGDARKIVRFIEALDDLEDVQEVYANFDVPDEALAEVA